MRSTLILRLRRAALAASAASLLAGTATWAQEEAKAEEPPKAEEPTKAEEAPAEPAKAEEAPAKAEEAKAEEAPAAAASNPREGQLAAPADDGDTETYTVQKGDTLWDLSNKFLKNPWYWPKIWSLNPGIENPHWIYPGNALKVKTGPGGKASVAQVEGQASGDDAESQDRTEAAPSLPPKPKNDAPDLAVSRAGKREFANSGVSVSGRASHTLFDQSGRVISTETGEGSVTKVSDSFVSQSSTLHTGSLPGL